MIVIGAFTDKAGNKITRWNQGGAERADPFGLSWQGFAGRG
ncbi:MAG: hypothetical protein WCZ65_10445 [Lysobacteraceae bacterium]